MITLNYNITEQEFKDFYYFTGWLAPEKKTYRFKHHLSSTISYLIIFALIFYLKGFIYFDAFTTILFLIPLVGLYYYTNYRMRSYFYRWGKKVYNDSENESIEMVIGESGIAAKSKDAEAQYKWSAFVKKYETDTAYYLVMSSSLGLIIPIRVFNLASQKETFEKMLSQCLPLHVDLPIDDK